ncbi:ATP-binding cassette domain-containing protein [Moraxella nasicaprae]|uniref:ABC transporter ATP-binding protein n=1 Tax=Moraxella nasicaprae TaxID=2904122 RepID=A0ABY6F568_9GAMM|nr:ABC transporter ATP-binding protein [Moraxella nasicaprae]UXZ05245.1 ABC transporter ATP-binding protein [Moraxella nasicaprae]
MRDVYLLLNRHYLLASIFIIIQQLIVASSTYFIAKLGEQFGNGVLNSQFIIAFIVSLIIVYIPAYFSIIYLEKGKYRAWQDYIKAFDTHFLGKATLFNNQTQKQTTTALLSQESKDTIDDFSNIIFDLFSLLLNVLLNIGVIAFVLDTRILWAYGIGMALSFLLIYYLNCYIDDKATTAQNTRLSLIGILHHSWDNIILNNHYNYHLFSNQTDKQFIKTTHTNLSAEKIRYVSATIAMLILMIPVLGVSLYLFKQNWHNNAVLAVLIATLPRQIQLLQMCYTLISYNVGLAMIKARINGLFTIFKDNHQDLTPFIQYDKISIKQTNLPFDKDTLPKTGRMTLIGQNGVGKSSLLLQLKEHFGDKAYYLPAKHSLCFANTMSYQGSSGQQLLSQLDELSKVASDDIKVLLLDEWDAHLDKNNMAMVDEKLIKLANQFLVIEIRHR